MKASAESTARNQRKRTFRVPKFQMPSFDMVEVSGEDFDEGPDKKSSGKLKQSVESKDGNKSFKEVAKTGGVKEKGKKKEKDI